jgi:exosortase/archaeosortase family protein
MLHGNMNGDSKLTVNNATPAATGCRDRWFPVLFILCTAISTTLISYLPDTWLNIWRDILIALTRGIGTATGLDVRSIGDIMTVNGFPMQIIMQCTALHYIIIVNCAILLSRWHSLRYRLAGVAVAMPLLVLFNSIRLLCTGLAGTISRATFVFVHSYLWVTVFILLSFAIWAIWDNKAVPRIGLSRFTIMAAVFCSLFQLCLATWSYQMDRVMALLAANLLKVLPGTTEFAISMYAGKVLFSAGKNSFLFSISTELVVLTVFAGLAAAEIIHNGLTNIVKLVTGGITLLLFSITIITSCCPMIACAGKETATLYLWVCQGIMLALPLAMWWFIRLNPASKSSAQAH